MAVIWKDRKGYGVLNMFHYLIWIVVYACTFKISRLYTYDWQQEFYALKEKLNNLKSKSKGTLQCKDAIPENSPTVTLRTATNLRCHYFFLKL